MNGTLVSDGDDTHDVGCLRRTWEDLKQKVVNPLL